MGRLGYTSFLISPRLPAPAVAKLLEMENAVIFIYSPQQQVLANTVNSIISKPLKCFPLISRTSYDIPQNLLGPQFTRTNLDNINEHHRRYIVLHSSGSTGLPKPVSYTNARLLITVLTAQNLTSFQSLPFSHAFGLVTISQAIWTMKTIYLFNGHLPHTHDTLTEAIVTAEPEIVWTVPYLLKLLAEKRGGIEALKKCYMVGSSGSRCPDELGDLLTNSGVFLGSYFGS